MYAIITENDESVWNDATGDHYHFPSRYRKFLAPGTKVIYYKGKLKDPKYSKSRLSPDPHYFGIAEIGQIHLDPDSAKNDLYADIVNFQHFDDAIPFKIDGEYLETIPATRAGNYWRDGVRPASKETYDLILSYAAESSGNTPPSSGSPSLPSLNDDSNTLESLQEGNPKYRYSTVYERNPRLRRLAIKKHSCTCMACGFNFEDFYGSYAAGFIHVHHLEPISEYGGAKSVDPEKDLIPLCANCHSVVHRRKDKTLSLDELKSLIHRAKSSEETA